jgi:hypothetical protein
MDLCVKNLIMTGKIQALQIIKILITRLIETSYYISRLLCRKIYFLNVFIMTAEHENVLLWHSVHDIVCLR